MSPTPSVVIIQSSSPRRDYEILVSILPRRFQSEETGDDNGNSSINGHRPTPTANDRRAFSLVAASESSASKRSNKKISCDTTILILPNPTILSYNNNNANSNVSVTEGGRSITDDVGFETVPLTTTMNSKTNRIASSFASLILDSKDELRSVTKLVSEQEGLAMVEKTIQVTNTKDSGSSRSSSSSSSTSTLPMAKFMLPGGCMITLSTAPCWTSPEARRLTMEFMTDATPMTPQSVSGSVSSINSKSSPMRRTMSMPDMIPPMVTMKDTRKKSNTRKVPSLETRALSLGGNYEHFPLNAETPIPVETELFKGSILLLCRPNDPAKEDPYWNERVFSTKRRRIILQLQGKLKYTPTGTVYAGMEVSDPMKLGLIANGMCNLILKLIRTFNPAVHYSFGSKKERAHISFPASSFFETFIVTPPGETPPTMGGLDLEGELPEDAAARKANKTKIDWNSHDTYTMSFHSMYIDFASWSIVSLPIGRDVSLQTFWGNSFASIVFYEVGGNGTKAHDINSTKYIMGIQLESLGENGVSAKAAVSSSTALLEKVQSDESDEGDETSELGGSELGGEESISSTVGGDTSLMPALDEENNDDEIDTSLFFDTIESLPGAGDESVDATILSTMVDNNLFSSSSHNTLLSIIDTFCPCWIDMFSSKRGKYTTLFAFAGTKRKPLFRTEEMVEQVVRGNREEDAEVDDRFSHRVSSLERTRRIFGWKYAEAHTSTTEKGSRIHKAWLKRFHKIPSRYDAVFLKQRGSTTTKVMGDNSAIIARALSDRHWKEERIVLSEESGDLLFHHVDGSKIHFRISLSSVIEVSPFLNTESGDLLPLPSYHYLQIETFVKATILMFSSEQERDFWVETLEAARIDRSTRLYASELLQFEIPVEEFLSKSTMWNCQKRKLLNCRRHSFRTPRSKTPEETLELAEQALTNALALQPTGANDLALRAFLDSVAALKEADAHSLNDEEKCAFFLNIYHIMIMHSFIILGPPSSGSEWISYFNNIAYQCSDDIFSLAELEHNIIRAEMCYPSNFLSRFVLPKSQYHFALVKPDFRLNFCLNSGSLSMPTPVVPIYKANELNKQLNSTTREFVGYTVHVKHKGKNDVQITLPRVCQWFAEDFGSSASASEVVAAIEPYLSKEKREALSLIWNAKKQSYEIGRFGLKHLPFNYECRFLTASLE